MNIEKFNVERKTVTLYHSPEACSPLIILNSYAGDGKTVMETVEKLGGKNINLLCISNLDWDSDMTPWYCPPISPKDSPCAGGADKYLGLLLEKIIPKTKEILNGEPSHLSIAGYSLAGLFALYALYKTDVFDRVASMSGSLWFPNFKEYIFSHEMRRKPKMLYLSLGDKEAKTGNQYIMTVQENTESIVEHYKSIGIDVIWEMNTGNHFKDAALRSAKGILAII